MKVKKGIPLDALKRIKLIPDQQLHDFLIDHILPMKLTECN